MQRFLDTKATIVTPSKGYSRDLQVDMYGIFANTDLRVFMTNIMQEWRAANIPSAGIIRDADQIAAFRQKAEHTQM